TVAMTPYAIVFGFAGLSYRMLASVTGATDPLAMNFDGGTQIPEIVWIIYSGFWFVFIMGVIVFAVLRLRQGRTLPAILLGHSVLFFTGLFVLALCGSINFAFQL
ncbi:MAG: hypothetical protein AAF244_04655, partial [Pseudomonadota bacterium]